MAVVEAVVNHQEALLAPRPTLEVIPLEAEVTNDPHANYQDHQGVVEVVVVVTILEMMVIASLNMALLTLRMAVVARIDRGTRSQKR